MSSPNPNPKLFVSFTTTMNRLVAGMVSEEDLARGLFCFGCTRVHAITPGANSEYVELAVRKRPDLHAKLVEALLKAEAEGRVHYRQAEEDTNFAMVSALLEANGFKPLAEAESDESYSYVAVAERSTELEVVL